MSRGQISYREPVKIVIINTQYVETDASSFKSVVQSLTGKDSVIPWPAEKSSSKNKLQTRPTVAKGAAVDVGGGGGGGGGNKAVMARGMSFKDLDRLLMEFPSIDELYRLCVD